MRLRQQLLTKNDCFRLGRPLQVQGVMVHSTGANNPLVCRYIPGNDELGRNSAGNHWDRPGLSKCVHAFLGKFADGEVGVVQTLPWDRKGWHSGSGSKPVSANSTHIGFEICEDGLHNPDYFRAVYREAVELTAMLCQKFSLDPQKPGVVICHAEGHSLGIASGHGDVLQWWPKHGATMDQFRLDVAAAMAGEEEDMTQERFDEMMNDYLARQAQLPPGGWSADARKWAEESGVVAGDGGGNFRYQSFASREEIVQMLYRLNQPD